MITRRHRQRRPIRWLRLVAAFWLAMAGALGSLIVFSPAAHAAGDAIDSYKIDYTLQTSGVLQVKETLVYRFGTNSGRHGIERALITREPDIDANADKDILYTIDDFAVTSPSGVSTDVSERTEDKQDGRFVSSIYRIGNSSETIDSETATYVITYQVRGAMRSKADYDELYWDAIGDGWKATLDNISITASVPGGPQGLNCYVGPPGPQSNVPCDSKATVAGKATFTQSQLAQGDGLTIGVKIKSGLISDNKPHLVPKAEGGSSSGSGSGDNTGLVALAGGAVGLSAVLSAVVGFLVVRFRGRDLRFLDLPPGTIPPPGAPTGRIGKSDPKMEIPVAFSPPATTVAEAGLLVDGQVDARETAATLVDLAVRGAIKIDGLGSDEYGVRIVDYSRATAPHERALLNEIFHGRPVGSAERLDERGAIREAHDAMVAAVRSEVQLKGWFTSVPAVTNKQKFGFAGIAFGGVMFFLFAKWLLAILLIFAPIAIATAVVRNKLRRGQRTPVGRAVCDQVEGFKKYLETAEADQLRFEEGEDIFSRYLPWAIAFDLADRWARICGELVEMGRLPNAQPYWYGGDGFSVAAFNAGFLTSSLTNAATAPVSSGGSSGFSGFSGGGFGSGGSSFGGGGGFSGGGGGGGGGGSW